MEENYLYQLAELVLPRELLRYFFIVKIEYCLILFCIHLDEKMEKELLDDVHFESKGFMDSVEVTDFPIRDHKVVLHVRRRRWLTAAGRNIILDRYSLLADNTSYSKEFADVLKKIFGYLPDNGPLAGAIL